MQTIDNEVQTCFSHPYALQVSLSKEKMIKSTSNLHITGPKREKKSKGGKKKKPKGKKPQAKNLKNNHHHPQMKNPLCTEAQNSRAVRIHQVEMEQIEMCEVCMLSIMKS